MQKMSRGGYPEEAGALGWGLESGWQGTTEEADMLKKVVSHSVATAWNHSSAQSFECDRHIQGPADMT